MFVFILITLISKSEPEVINCKDLAIGQFVCQTPNVSNDTQVHILKESSGKSDKNVTFFICCRNTKAVVKKGEFV